MCIQNNCKQRLTASLKCWYLSTMLCYNLSIQVYVGELHYFGEIKKMSRAIKRLTDITLTNRRIVIIIIIMIIITIISE